MIYQIHIPKPPLSFFIAHFFYYEGYHAEHVMEKFLPDCSMDLLIDLTDTPKKLFHNEEGTTFTTYKKSWMSGMKTEYILIDASVSSMIGVHFKPGGAYPFFDFPVNELIIFSYHFLSSPLSLYCSEIRSSEFSAAPAWLCLA